MFLLNHIWLKFIFCHIPQRAASRFNVTRIYDLSLLSPRRAETELPAERLSHKNTDDAVDGRGSHEWLKLKFYQWQCRQTDGQTDRQVADRQLCSSAEQLSRSLVLWLQLRPTQQKKKAQSILCIVFLAAEEAKRSRMWFKNSLGSTACWLMIQWAGGWRSAAKLPHIGLRVNFNAVEAKARGGRWGDITQQRASRGMKDDTVSLLFLWANSHMGRCFAFYSISVCGGGGWPPAKTSVASAAEQTAVENTF